GLVRNFRLVSGDWGLVHSIVFTTHYSPVIHQHILEQEAKYSRHSELFSHPRQNSWPTIRVQDGPHHIKVVEASRYCRGEFSRCCPCRPRGRRGREDLKTVENRFFAIAGIFASPRQ